MAAIPQNDPRRRITPESFAIAPELLGLPLASPIRRLTALLLDLVPVAILAGAGVTVFLAFALALVAWRSVTRGRAPGTRRRSGSIAIRFAIALTVFVTVLRIGGQWSGDGDAEPGFLAGGFSPATFSDPDSIDALVERVSGGWASIDVSDATSATTPSTADRLTPAQRDSLVIAYADAIARRDTGAARALAPAAADVIAYERIATLEDQRSRLRRRNDALEEANRELQDELEKASRPPGLRAILMGWLDDLGIGFGWGALYFTLFTATGRGQTPGKRLMGVRVIRLDGKRMGWWYAFERFGGYFACVTTGLLGFAQILWDRNRQGLHDKIAGTVVIRDARKRARG